MEILLVIDIQQKYMNSYDSDLLDRVNMRIHEAVASDMPVVYVRNVGKLDYHYLLDGDLGLFHNSSINH